MADHDCARTPGELLRGAREDRGLGLDAAEEGTKIPVRLLMAIERDEYHKLSGPLYVRSFLRNYASWLELDAGEILRAYDAVAGRPEAAAGSEDMTWQEDAVSVQRVGVPWRRYAGIVVVTVVGFVVVVAAVWYLLTRFSGGDNGAEVAREPAAVPETVVRVDPAAATADTIPIVAVDRYTRLSRDTLVFAGSVVEKSPSAAEAVTPPPVARVAPRPGLETLAFSGGRMFPLVLRVLVPERTNCSVRRDVDPAARPVIWPETPQPLPEGDVEAGVAYVVRGGYAMYWGTADNFTLMLDEPTGAAATLNGLALPVDQWRQRQPVVLDRFTLQRIGQ